MTAARAIHASAVVVGEAGVLLRGRSGAGKSTLARRLVEAAGARGLFARLLADDRVLLAGEHGRLVARPHPAIAGRLEVRGIGILPVAYADAAVIRLVVDCDGIPLDRSPSPDQKYVELAGVSVRRIAAEPDDAERVLFALHHPDEEADATEPQR